MAEARRREAWQHTSWLMSLIANCHRDPKRRPEPFTPDELNPLAERKSQEPVTRVGVGFLKTLFIDQKG